MLVDTHPESAATAAQHNAQKLNFMTLPRLCVRGFYTDLLPQEIEMKHFIVTVYTAGGCYRGQGIARSSFELEDTAAEHFGTEARCIVVRLA